MEGYEELMEVSWRQQTAFANDTAALGVMTALGIEGRGASVVIAAYEEHKYIGKTVQSILNESPLLGLREIIVVDDFNLPPISSAMSPELLKHPFVKIIRNSEHRVSAVYTALYTHTLIVGFDSIEANRRGRSHGRLHCIPGRPCEALSRLAASHDERDGHQS